MFYNTALRSEPRMQRFDPSDSDTLLDEEIRYKLILWRNMKIGETTYNRANPYCFMTSDDKLARMHVANVLGILYPMQQSSFSRFGGHKLFRIDGEEEFELSPAG